MEKKRMCTPRRLKLIMHAGGDAVVMMAIAADMATMMLKCACSD